jgi:hypothetical protein
VVGPHPIAVGWYRIRLDANELTPYSEWSVPGDRLVREDLQESAIPAGLALEGKTIKHFP